MAAFAVMFGFTWWLGLYVLLRGAGERAATRAGLGILLYALALAAEGLRLNLPGASPVFGYAETMLLGLPLLLWTGACLALVPGTETLDRIWRFGLLPAGVVALAAVTASGGLFGEPHPLYVPLALLLIAPLIGVVVLLFRARPPRVWWLLAVATLFAGLGGVLFLLPGGLPGWLVRLSVAPDILLLGVAMSMSGAFDSGERLWRDLFRSLLGAVVAGVLFGGQVLAVAALNPSAAPAVFGVVAAAVAVQTLADPLHRLLDRLAFPGNAAIRQERAELRESADALPRRADGVPADEREFVRLTRRALAAYGDLAKLTSSPLVNLPVIEERLRGRGPGQPLDRAAELKQLLLESIVRLKPREGEFGTSEEWRYYNVLYFPYVAGLRPYRTGATKHGLTAVESQAFDWFVTQVPERTLYNWQNAAAKLVADDLRTREKQEIGSEWQ
ncbi:hypothetical protein [Rhizohabitans arisaemae]|uniref:hypothetical protein n=1 Tax=Rhizohabitans arisaemae TaxID=2720610 RepID=UPI0024B1535C|nr:hypothetical protein [Rhizohabitans arisaemae]